MKQVVTEKDVEKGAVVWIKRRRCTISDVHPVTNLRLFKRDGSDKVYSLRDHELQLLVRRWDIVPDRIHRELPPEVAKLLVVEWSLLSEQVRRKAEARAAVCRELDAYGPVKRRQEAIIEMAIAKVGQTLGKDAELPSAQRIRRHWDQLWIAGLKNPAALLDLAHLKGNRRPFDRDSYGPVINLVEGLITEFITSRVNKKESLSTVQNVAEDLVSTLVDDGNWRERPFARHMIKQMGESDFERHPVVILINEFLANRDTMLHPLVDGGQHRSIGVNLVRNRFKRRNVHEQVMYRTTRKQANLIASGIEEGPIVDLPLQRVEADSTTVDQLVVRVDGKAKRMEITLFKDVCSGVITGLHYGFEPANWFSIHEGMRMSALPKADFLKTFDYPFVSDWPVYGVADVLVLDRASTHRGGALAGMAMKVGFEIADMPAASGHLKGAVEKSLGDFMRQHVVSQPGYTGANILERDPERAVPECTEKQALEAAVAYIVDYYNQQEQPGTGEIRINRFKRLMDQAMAWKFPPDPSLFPGKAVSAKLTAKGVSLNGLRYRSPALLKMFFDAGGNCDVVVFIPRYGQDVVRVGELTGPGHVEAYLGGNSAGLGLTHEEALARHREAKRSKSTNKQAEKARDSRLSRSLANDVQRGKPRRHKKVTAPPSKPGANLAVPVFDAAVSASGDFLGHDLNKKHEFETLGKLGGAFAVPGPGTRAVQKSIEMGAQSDVPPSLPITGGFMPDKPDPNAKLPVSAALATPNTAPPAQRKAEKPPEVNSSLKPLPKAFKF